MRIEQLYNKAKLASGAREVIKKEDIYICVDKESYEDSSGGNANYWLRSYGENPSERTKARDPYVMLGELRVYGDAWVTRRENIVNEMVNRSKNTLRKLEELAETDNKAYEDEQNEIQTQIAKTRVAQAINNQISRATQDFKKLAGTGNDNDPVVKFMEETSRLSFFGLSNYANRRANVNVVPQSIDTTNTEQLQDEMKYFNVGFDTRDFEGITL